MFRIRRMGINSSHNSRFAISRPYGYNCWLFLFVKSSAVFAADGSEISVKPNTCIIYRPGSPHFYRASDSVYINDWIQFDTDMQMTHITANKPIYLGDAVGVDSYTSLIAEAFYRDNQPSCEHLMLAMLLEIAFICGNSTLKGPHSADLAQLRRELYSSPQEKWTISMAAEKLYISGSYFQELYKKAFGVSFGCDIIKSRIDSAAELLTFTDMSVAEISYKCGYTSPVHFTRQFSKLMGASPSEWRKQNSR